MLTDMWLVSTLAISVVLIVSGVLKAVAPESVDEAWEQLRVPRVLSTRWIRRCFPWSEIALGTGLILLPHGWLTMVATLCVALMSAYVLLVVRAVWYAHRWGIKISCHCFGALQRATVSWRTVLRNVVLLGVAGTVLIGAPPEAGSWAQQAWETPHLLVSAIPAVGVLAVLWWEQGHEQPGHNAQDDDYVREPIPRYVVTRGLGPVGEQVTLRQLCLTHPVLLIRLDPGCGSCDELMGRWQQMSHRVGPTVAVFPVLAPGISDNVSLGQVPMDDVLVDHAGLIDAVFNTSGVPWAVLLGADGWTAGGPEKGTQGIDQMIDEIEIFLHEGASQ